MALLKTRPTIELLVPRSMSPGGRFEAEVRLHAPEDVEVDYVRVDLRCRAGWTTGSGKNQVSRYDDLLRLEGKPFGGPVLTRGDHSLRTAFDLPPGLPPTLEGSGTASVRWSIDVEVSIPWWPDARSHHPLPITMRDERTRGATPATCRQRVSESNLGAPRIEASVTSSTLAPGGRIAGAIALYNFDPGVAYPIRIGLLERNTLYTRRMSERMRHGRSWFVGVESPAGPHEHGTPFEFRVPADVVPSFRCPAFDHSYTLEIEVKTGLLSSSTLSVPITIVNDDALKDESMRLATPAVGATRMAELGQEVAARRGYVIDGGSLTRSVRSNDAPLAIDIRHETRAGEGTFLVGSIAYPRLGLALSIEPQTGIAGYFTRDVEIDRPAWDRAHRVSARDAAQAIALLRPLVDQLGQDARFAAVSDESVRVIEPDPALSAQSLDAFAARMERIALAVGERLGAVPPPTGMDAGAEWSTLAARLGARFVVGDLSLDDGKLGSAEVQIETRWDDVPRHRIELLPDPPLPDEVSIHLVLPRAEAATAEGLSAEVRALLARLPEDAAQLSLGGGRITIELPFDRSGATPRARPADVSSVLDLLARLGPLFGVRRGPFR
jgi:hypothetical protein